MPTGYFLISSIAAVSVIRHEVTKSISYHQRFSEKSSREHIYHSPKPASSHNHLNVYSEMLCGWEDSNTYCCEGRFHLLCHSSHHPFNRNSVDIQQPFGYAHDSTATKTSCDNITRFPHLCRCTRSRCSIVQYGWRSASSRVLQLFSEQQPGVCSRFTHPTRQCLCHVIMILDKPFSSQACHFSILFPLFLCCFYVLSPFASPLIFDKSSICLIINQYHSEGRREA